MTTPTGPGGVSMPTSELLEALARRLQEAGAAVTASLGLSGDAPMWNSPELYKDYFGPATEIADEYVDLTQRFKPYVLRAANSLYTGGEAFHGTARLFADAEADAAAQIGKGPR